MPRRPSSRTVLTPSSRRMVAGLLIAAGILLVIGQLLNIYVLLFGWRTLDHLEWGSLLGTLLGIGAGVLTSYVGWRVGRATG